MHDLELPPDVRPPRCHLLCHPLASWASRISNEIFLLTSSQLRANDYRYKKLSQKQFTERGTYVAYKGSTVVPYPSRVPGTDMFNKARAAEAAQAAHSLKAKNARELKAVAKGRANGVKRRALAQPEAQPGAKRPTTRSAARAEKDDEDDDGGIETPDASLVEPPEGPPARHIQGLLTAAIDSADLGDSNAATPRHSPDIEEEDEGADRGDIPPRMRTPDPPKGLGDFDEQGLALMQRGPKANNRFAVKPTFQFDPLDIGFRDSTNDHAKIKNAPARGKYLDQPNTDNFFYDPLLWNYDARNQSKGDLDKALVAKFGVHPKYGLFVPNSRNPAAPSPSEMTDSHPVVFLTPSGETLHASRSYQAVVTAKNVDEDILARKMTATLDALYESHTDLSMKARKRHEKEIPERYSGPSLGLIQREATEEASVSGSAEESTPPPTTPAAEAARVPAGVFTPLVKAAIMASAEDASTQRTETPARTVSRPYDAIRDVFTSSSPKPQAEPAHNLAVLADVAWGSQPSHAQYAPAAGYADQGYQQTPYQLPQLAPAPASIGQPQYTQEPTQFHSRLPPSAREQEGYATRSDPYSDAHMPPQNIPAHPAQYQHRYETPGPVSSHREPYPMSVERDMEPRHYQPGAESMIDPRLRGLDHERPPAYYDYEQHRPAPAGYPPPPPPMHGHPAPQAPPHPSPYTAPPPPSHPPPRREYSSSTALPPLRPPRQLGQPYESPADRMGHPHQRISSVSSAGPFYSPGPPPQFHNSFGPPEQPPQMMGGGPSSYGQQPSSTGYRQGTLSPTYSSAQIPFQSLAPTPPPATPPDAPASLGGSSRRATFHHYAPAPSPQSNNAKYRKLEPAPIPAHRIGWNNEPQLRTVGYNPTEDIKDYSANEPLPGRGPTFIRGWNVSNGGKKRGSRGRDEKEEPR